MAEEIPFSKHFKDQKEEKEMTKKGSLFLFAFIFICLALFGITFAFNQNYQYIEISGKSMQPTLNPNPVLVEREVNGVKKEVYVQDGVFIRPTQDVDYEDIIILDEVFEDTTIIKRALAFDGDYITIAKIEDETGFNAFRLMRIKEGSSKIEVLEEVYIKSHWEWATYCHPAESQIPQDADTVDVIYEIDFYSTFSKGDYEEKLFTVDGRQIKFFKVPDDEVFYMGDNRTNSTDAREEGTAKISQIVGYVVRTVRNGTYYNGNIFFFFNRFGEALSLIWDEILRFFGANI